MTEIAALSELDVPAHEPYHHAPFSDACFEHARGWRPRAGDTLIVTAPKTGTTLLQQVCHQLRVAALLPESEPEDDPANVGAFDDIYQVAPWLEMAFDLGQDLETHEATTLAAGGPPPLAPRVFKTHWRLGAAPRAPGVRYVCVVRDPVATARSWLEFLRVKGAPPVVALGDDARALAAFMRGGDDDATAGFWREGMRFGATLWEYYLEMWGAREHPAVLVLEYETLADPAGLRRALPLIARHLGVRLAADGAGAERAARLDAVARRCARDAMRAPLALTRFDESWAYDELQRVGRIADVSSFAPAPRVRAAAAPSDDADREAAAVAAAQWTEFVTAREPSLSSYEALASECRATFERRLSAALAADAAADAEPQGLAEAPPPPPPPATAADAPPQPLPPPPPLPSQDGATIVRVTLPPGKAGVIMRDARDDDPFAGGHGDNPGDDAPYIRQLLPTASALLAANVAPGYRMLSINGASCAGVSADEAAEALKQAADQPARELVLAPPPPPALARAAVARDAGDAASARAASLAAVDSVEAAASRAVRAVREVSWESLREVSPLGAGADGLGGEQAELWTARLDAFAPDDDEEDEDDDDDAAEDDDEAATVAAPATPDALLTVGWDASRVAVKRLRPEASAVEAADLARELRVLALAGTLTSTDDEGAQLVVELVGASAGALALAGGGAPPGGAGGAVARPFVVLRLVDGESLQARLERARAARVRAGSATVAAKALAGQIGGWANRSLRRLSSGGGGDGGGGATSPPTSPVETIDDGRLSMAGALELSHRLAIAIEWLHSLGERARDGALDGARVAVLHRDLKPANVVLRSERRTAAAGGAGAPVLLDFGLARALVCGAESPVDATAAAEGRAGDPTPLFRMTPRTGSQRYMAPEVALGSDEDASYSLAADVFSLALLIWEACATATPSLSRLGAPFANVLSAAEHERRVARGGERPPLPSGLDGSGEDTWPAGLCELLARCWNADPSARPTASEVSAALAELLVHEKHRAFLHGLG